MAKAKVYGKDFDFFKKMSVSNASFGASADMVIAFPTQGLFLLNEGTTSTQVIEYSFNGNTVHGELDPTLPSRGLMFDNRIVNLIWFRVKTGSTGPITVRVDAWATR